MDTHWADSASTLRSYELIAKYAIPKINGLNKNRLASEGWLRENNKEFKGQLVSAVRSKMKEHIKDQGMSNVSPELATHFEVNEEKKPSAG